MRRTVLVLCSAFLAACSPLTSNEGTSVSSEQSSVAPPADQGLPIDAVAEVPRDANVPCPYLDTNWVADTNGQKVTSQGIDERFDTPACVFWSYQDDPQLQVIVRHMADEQQAVDVVNWAAPINETEPAEEPEGWSGGRLGSEGRSLYAVQKGNVAVVVFSNQGQSIKVELVAKEVIARLGL
ncbi:DUF2020 domain-containing protein [Corynebacterium sp.]|uniref:DUF2020 domain-containing protein n=1 Tax=Corynebacterium sp. TaxID=1720 RepID=UPI0026DD5931|nr:DUF2020 domain-containing protein [Corynebacterium sp.]MDO5076684.1 DUF2020 domain-containing protein [Corynebacterium sp.]